MMVIEQIYLECINDYSAKFFSIVLLEATLSSSHVTRTRERPNLRRAIPLS